MPELKLLVDSVQSSKFITHKKTTTLIKKIETLASIHEAQLLNRQVFVANRIKTMNESIYYNVDAIHTGIANNKKIKFKYFEYAVDKSRRYRKDGAFYVMSPFAMAWDDENYYLVACDGILYFIATCFFAGSHVWNQVILQEIKSGALADMACFPHLFFIHDIRARIKNCDINFHVFVSPKVRIIHLNWNGNDEHDLGRKGKNRFSSCIYPEVCPQSRLLLGLSSCASSCKRAKKGSFSAHFHLI